MKYSMKLTASIMAAVMAVSSVPFCTGAVDFIVIDGVTQTKETVATTDKAVQNAVADLYNGCVKLSWAEVGYANMYAVKICSSDGKVVKTLYVSKKFKAVTVPETVFGVEHNKSAEFFACVIALKPNESDNAYASFYAPETSRFTVPSDMSKYPEYGTPYSISFLVKDGKLLIGWKNPNDFAEQKDLFSVSVEDESGKSVYSTTTKNTYAEASNLKDNKKYTIKIYNKTQSAMDSAEYTFVSDMVQNKPGQSGEGSYVKKDSVTKLPAPLTVTVKNGDKRATISWSKVDGADAYRIFMYDAKSKSYKRKATVKGTKYTVKKLSNGKTYKFKVMPVEYDEKTKTYTAGIASKVVKAVPKAPEKTSKLKSNG